jgi:YD repeat-containing protein
MRLVLKKNLADTKNETTSTYDYDDRGNLIRETTAYTGSGLPSVSERTAEYTYDGYGNRIRESNTSGSPARVTEKTFDERLHQFVVQDRAFGDAFTFVNNYEINYGTAFGGINKKTDPNGNSTYFEYDSIGRLKVQKADVNYGIETLNEYSYSTDFPLSVKMIQHAGNSSSSPLAPGAMPLS